MQASIRARKIEGVAADMLECTGSNLSQYCRVSMFDYLLRLVAAALCVSQPHISAEQM